MLRCFFELNFAYGIPVANVATALKGPACQTGCRLHVLVLPPCRYHPTHRIMFDVGKAAGFVEGMVLEHAIWNLVNKNKSFYAYINPSLRICAGRRLQLRGCWCTLPAVESQKAWTMDRHLHFDSPFEKASNETPGIQSWHQHISPTAPGAMESKNPRR